MNTELELRAAAMHAHMLRMFQAAITLGDGFAWINDVRPRDPSSDDDEASTEHEGSYNQIGKSLERRLIALMKEAAADAGALDEPYAIGRLDGVAAPLRTAVERLHGRLFAMVRLMNDIADDHDAHQWMSALHTLGGTAVPPYEPLRTSDAPAAAEIDQTPHSSSSPPPSDAIMSKHATDAAAPAAKRATLTESEKLVRGMATCCVVVRDSATDTVTDIEDASANYDETIKQARALDACPELPTKGRPTLTAEALFERLAKRQAAICALHKETADDPDLAAWVTFLANAKSQ